MKIEQIYTGCLAEATYYIESNGEAVIIDPLRETEPYLAKLKDSGAKLKYIFETHFHADFVSGHVDLAKATGATIVYGPNAETTFDALIAEDGVELKLGDITFKVLHTPGHTMESTTYLLLDESGKEHAIFTGDTLFIGDVGRPDLAQKGADLTIEDLAGYLFDSLRNKIMPMADDVLVYPAHGAGSACGKNMSDDTWDTLGHQKKTNYALRADMTKDEFVKEVTTGLLAPPQYFAKNVAMNKQGYESVDLVVAAGLRPLTAEQVELEMEAGTLVLDTRDPEVFAKGFIPGSMNIGLDGSFGPWVGALIEDIEQRIVLVTEPGKEKEAVTRLSRVGYDHAVGYLEGGIEAWQKDGRDIDHVKSIEAKELKMLPENHVVLDVRKESEYLSEHVEGAINEPLDNIRDWMDQLDPAKTYYIHCKSGYRSMITMSMLKAKGIDHIVNVEGGFEAIKETNVDCSEYVCPSEL